MTAALVLALAAALTAAPASPRDWQPVVVDGADLPTLHGVGVERIAALRCEATACAPMPLQIDERDEAGEWALPDGAAPTVDESPAVFDANDALSFMFADAGGRAPEAARAAGAELEIELSDPLGYPPRYAYLAVLEGAAPTAPRQYVFYDAADDRLRGAVTLGFAGGVPAYLALAPGGDNVLDRLKIRATATFLWGLFGVTRSEEDLLPLAPTWKAGPIRVIRRQPMLIRMRFGLRSPRFVSTTFFYRDFAELPLRIRLRVPPRYFFTSIHVRGGLDFRRLPGAWRAILPGGTSLPATCAGAAELRRDGVAGDWFALQAFAEPAPGFTIVQRLARGPSLESVRQSTWYRCGRAEDPPEGDPGQWPALGFALNDWDGVEGGVHTLTSGSYAVPLGADLDVFLATLATPLEVSITALAPPATPAVLATPPAPR